MARCYSCNKNFDYEKYYGICPKCGAYNKKETPQEEHQELHRQYDNTEIPQSHYEDMGTSTSYNMGASTTYNEWSAMADEKPKKSSLGGVVFIALVIGIICAIVIPIQHVGGTITKLMEGTPTELSETEKESEDSVSQEAPIILGDVYQSCKLGHKGELEITVEEARIVVPAGTVVDFPEGENLVGITIRFANSCTEYYDYLTVDKFYVKYGVDTYKRTLKNYDVSDYMGYLEGVTVLDEYETVASGGHGELLVFVPEGVETIELYLESRNEKTNELIEIYQIPLEIQ